MWWTSRIRLRMVCSILFQEVFRKSGMSCMEKAYKESIRGLFINLKVFRDGIERGRN